MTGSYTVDIVALVAAALALMGGLVSLLTRALVTRTLAEIERRAEDHERRIRGVEGVAARARTADDCERAHDRMITELRRELDSSERARADVVGALTAVREAAAAIGRDRERDR